MAILAAEGSNGSVSGEALSRYLNEIDRQDDKLLQYASEHMERCKGPRGKIREVMQQAKHDGLNMSAFRLSVRKHRSERKIAAKMAELEADAAADYEAMQEALGEFGETELGQAALKRAAPKGSDKLDTLRT
jgi:hypothetical protein